jgi:hypothetical protein
MPNLVYENFYLANEVEDQYNSHLDLVPFFEVKNELEGQAGMDYIVHRYSASDSVADVQQGAGNVSDSEATYVEKKYTIKTAQGRFKWYDEEEKKDPFAIAAGVGHLGVDMFNHEMGDFYTEMKKAEIVVPATYLDFDAFVDGLSMFNLETGDDVVINGFVAPSDAAEVRKKLKDTLQYVEAYARTGYIGTVSGVNLYVKKDMTETGVIYLAFRDAITLFNKTGVEYEPERDANTRMNRSYVRKYFVVALTNAAHLVKIAKGATATACPSTETTVDTSKTYYAKEGLGYIKVTPAATDNPYAKGWYTISF